MSQTLLTSKILPLAEFKARASELLNAQKVDKDLIVITQNGKSAAVLVTPEEFDRLNEHDRFLHAVEEGFEDARKGRLVEDRDLKRHLDEEFGPSSKRK